MMNIGGLQVSKQLRDKYRRWRKCDFRILYLISGHLRELSELFESNNPYYKVQEFMIKECENYIGSFYGHHFISKVPDFMYQPFNQRRARDPDSGYDVIVVDYKKGFHDLIHNNTVSKIDNKQGNYNITGYLHHRINQYASNESCEELFKCDFSIENYDYNDDIKKQNEKVNTNIEIGVITTKKDHDEKNDLQVIYDCNGDILYKNDIIKTETYKIGDMVSIEINTKKAIIIFKKNNNQCGIIKDIDVSQELCVMIRFKPNCSICQCLLSNCSINSL